MSELKKARIGRAVAAVVAMSYLAGCSTAAKDVTTTYVSPTQFASYDCQQLAAEAQRLQVRFTELGGRLDQAASNDKTITGVGLILFWPALFALGGTKAQEAEYGRLRGEYEAVQQASIQKKCSGGAAAVPGAAAASSAS
jgi:outer membrane murein-binding lipoprotein Lpp